MPLAASGAIKVQPKQYLASLVASIHLQRWILLFLLGPKPSGFLRAPGALWEEQRCQRLGLQELWFLSSIQSNLRHCHLSQLDLDIILFMEICFNLQMERANYQAPKRLSPFTSTAVESCLERRHQAEPHPLPPCLSFQLDLSLMVSSICSHLSRF